jgi:branched-subunit amino acid transport protein
MSSTEVWIIIVLLTVATVVTRSAFFLFGNAVKLPPKVQHALRYAPAAALAAIVVPDLVLSGGALDAGWTNPKLMAGIGAALFFLATRRMLETIIVGMAIFTIVRLAA